MRWFYEIRGFPGVVACVDGTHIPIKNPGGVRPEIYRNRHGWFSLNVQVAAGANMEIVDVSCRRGGSFHDATIFESSGLRKDFEEGRMHQGNPQSMAETRYNRAYISTRNVVERTLGVWKRRFRCLTKTLETSLNHSLSIILATIVLYNISRRFNDELPADEFPWVQQEIQANAAPIGPHKKYKIYLTIGVCWCEHGNCGRMHQGLLLGDNGYPCLPHLFPPLGNPQSTAETRYNRAHISTRYVVERTSGVWKRRFRCLTKTLETSLDHSLSIILATIVLYNISRRFNDELSEDEFPWVQQELQASAAPIGPHFTRQAFICNHFIRQAFIRNHFTRQAFICNHFIRQAFIRNHFTRQAFIRNHFIRQAFIRNHFTRQAFIRNHFDH
uniref:DDE Tnp4 domain-containing protein n=1 Tax=Timema shepardi TaxID=629360 RepID=A0A7R9B6X2_TIMSH|nr:unnamed protein product [Timema shepardi]